MDEEKKYWLDDAKNVDKICWGLYVVCALLVLSDLFYHKHDPHFGVDGWFGFYGFYGWISCVALVLAAKVVRVILGRREDYYD